MILWKFKDILQKHELLCCKLKKLQKSNFLWKLELKNMVLIFCKIQVAEEKLSSFFVSYFKIFIRSFCELKTHKNNVFYFNFVFKPKKLLKITFISFALWSSPKKKMNCFLGGWERSYSTNFPEKNFTKKRKKFFTVGFAVSLKRLGTENGIR